MHIDFFRAVKGGFFLEKKATWHRAFGLHQFLKMFYPPKPANGALVWTFILPNAGAVHWHFPESGQGREGRESTSRQEPSKSIRESFPV
jgi:hypothetical protein